VIGFDDATFVLRAVVTERCVVAKVFLTTCNAATGGDDFNPYKISARRQSLLGRNSATRFNFRSRQKIKTPDERSFENKDTERRNRSG